MLIVTQVNSKMILTLTASIMYWSLQQRSGGHEVNRAADASSPTGEESELASELSELAMEGEASEPSS